MEKVIVGKLKTKDAEMEKQETHTSFEKKNKNK